MLFRKVRDIEIIGDEVERIFDTWEYIKDIKSYFFNDLQKVNTQKDFQIFFIENVLDCCFAVKDGKIIYVSYIVISGYKSVYYCVYSNRVDNDIKLSQELNNIAIEYYKTRWNINRFDSYVKIDNRVSHLITRKIGFSLVGRIPKLFLVDGIATDYNYYILEV